MKEKPIANPASKNNLHRLITPMFILSPLIIGANHFGSFVIAVPAFVAPYIIAISY